MLRPSNNAHRRSAPLSASLRLPRPPPRRKESPHNQGFVYNFSARKCARATLLRLSFSSTSEAPYSRRHASSAHGQGGSDA
jgi:hypothetical protein